MEMRCVVLLALGATLAAGSVCRGNVQTHEPEEGALPAGARVVEDAAASQRKAVACKVEGGEGYVAEIVAAEPTAPGRYRATFRLKVDEPGHAGERLLLTVDQGEDGPRAARAVYGVHFGPDKNYQDLAVDFERTGRGKTTFKAGWQKELSERYLTHIWLSGKTDAEKYVTEWPDIKEIYFDRVTVEKIADTAAILKVQPQKVHYGLNEDASLTVTLRNYTKKKQKVTLKCELISELDTTREIFAKSITLGAGKDKEITVKWNTGREEYGFEARASIYRGKALLDTGSEYFGVSDNVFKVGIMKGAMEHAGYTHWSAKLNPEVTKEYMEGMRRVYSNIHFVNGWAPSDLLALTPETENWYGGQGRYPNSKSGLQDFVREAHKHGIKILPYGKGMAGGPPGYEVLRQHPEWFYYSSEGRFRGYGKEIFDIDVINRWNEGWFEGKGHWNGWPNAQLNMENPELVEYGIKEMIASVRMFGWDGVFYDGHFWVWSGYGFDGKPIVGPGETQDGMSARNTKRVHEGIRKEVPGFLFGYNWGPQYSHRYGGSRRPLDYAECCKGGGMIVNEQLRASGEHEGSPVAPNGWKDYAKLVKEDVKHIRKLGGYYFVIRPDKRYVIDRVYTEMLLFAAGAHGWGPSYHPRYGDYGQFATRYSAFLWDNRIAHLDDPGKVFAVEGPGAIWWKEFAAERTVPRKGRQLILHLINPPVSKGFYRDETNAIPARQKNIEVRARIPAGYRLKNAWLLSTGPQTRGTILPPRVEGDQVTVTVPELVLWEMVVFDLAAK